MVGHLIHETPNIRKPVARILSTRCSHVFSFSVSPPSPPQHRSYFKQQPPLLARCHPCFLAPSQRRQSNGSNQPPKHTHTHRGILTSWGSDASLKEEEGQWVLTEEKTRGNKTKEMEKEGRRHVREPSQILPPSLRYARWDAGEASRLPIPSRLGRHALEM